MLSDVDPRLTTEHRIKLEQLLQEHADIFTMRLMLPGNSLHAPHYIDTQGHPPLNIRGRRYSQAERDEIDKEVRKLTENNLIRRSWSPWSAPVVLVTKKDGT